MKPLRAAALVMLIVAALDGVIDLIERFAQADVWPVMLGVGIAVFLVDLIFDRRTVLGEKCYAFAEWLRRKFREAMARTSAALFGHPTEDGSAFSQSSKSQKQSSHSTEDTSAQGKSDDLSSLDNY